MPCIHQLQTLTLNALLVLLLLLLLLPLLLLVTLVRRGVGYSEDTESAGQETGPRLSAHMPPWQKKLPLNIGQQS
jgi:hypothetical protein